MATEQEEARLVVDGPDFLGLCKELLSKGSTVRVRVDGISMSPHLVPGEIVWIEPARAEQLRVGDVALYERDGRAVIHQLAGRSRRAGATLVVFHATGHGAIESVLEAEVVLGRVAAVEREGVARPVARLPIGARQQLRARWRLLTHGRLAEGSWVRRAPGRAVRAAGHLLSRANSALAGLKRAPTIGRLVRRLMPPLGDRVRLVRLVSREAKPGEALVIEAYLGRRKMGRASLARMFRVPYGWETWWIGVESHTLYRRRGIGRRLVQEMGRWAQERGAGPIHAAIREDNAASIALFGDLGYVRSEDEDLERRVSEHYTQRSKQDWTTVVYVAGPGTARTFGAQ